MYQEFWNLFYDYTFSQFYYQLYFVQAERKRRAVSGICLVASSAFLVSWYQSGEHGLLWALLLFACQLVAVLQPIFSYSEQVFAAKCLYEDLTRLVRDMDEARADFSQETTEAEFFEQNKAFRRRFDEIELRFATPALFPESALLARKAKKKTENYFRRFYADGE